MRILSIFLVGVSLFLSGCGFTPLYATAETGGKPALANVRLASITASNEAKQILERVFARRTAVDSEAAEYDLYLTVKEAAQQLAVQIDDSVTRYNYRMTGTYSVANRRTGETMRGRADATVSFNVVSSQYSTLFAEKDAREKAAGILADEIARDILVQLATGNEAKAAVAAANRK